MVYYKYLLLCLCLITACTPHIHNNTTFFKVQRINPRAQDVLRTVGIGDTLTITGILATHFTHPHQSALLYIHGKQLVFARLDSSIAQSGDKIHITGIVTQFDNSSTRTLSPIYVETLDSYQCYIELINNAVKKHNIQLPKKLHEIEWIMIEHQKNVIVFTDIVDIMTAHHFDFVFDTSQQKLKAIYIEKRFKGE